MAEVEFRVVHMNHAGGTISVHESLVGSSLRWGYRANDVGDISYDLALSDSQLQFAGPDSFAPYKTDWRLGMKVLDKPWEQIHGGIHTGAGLRPRTGVVNVSGKDWLHWLEQPVWFSFYTIDFDVTEHSNMIKQINKGYKHDHSEFDANGFLNGSMFKVWAGPAGATQQSVVQDLIDISNDGPYPVVNLSTAFLGTGWSHAIASYVIIVQDETNILEHLKAISAMSDPLGFDFYVDYTKTVNFFGPRRTPGTSPNAIWTLTSENTVLESIPDFDWLNNGPLGTYMVGLGSGSPSIWKLKFDPETVALYRRWLRMVRVGDIYNMSLTGVASGTQGLQFGYPHKDLKLTVKPDILKRTDPGDGFRNHIGDVVRFLWPIPPYHTIDAFFWITSQEFHSDPAGNYLCDLGLQQIYGQAP